MVKEVTNDNGGSARRHGLDPDRQRHRRPTTSRARPRSTPTRTLLADTWTLSETGGPSGYTASDWVCVGGSQGTGTDKDKITVGVGGEATCTITNDDIAPKLHLRKDVTNDNGGGALATAWTLKPTAPAPTTSRARPRSTPTARCWPTPGRCLRQAAPPATRPLTGSASAAARAPARQDKITVGVGGEATCTITNNDIAPKLHLRKDVTNDNGGGALATAWTLNANGTGTNDLSGSTPVDSDGTLLADTWTLSETGGPSGYTASDWGCVGGSQGTGTDKDKITVGVGGEATCTITNNDIAPKLHLRKDVTNDNGGGALATPGP